MAGRYPRKLHNHSLVAVGLSVGYDTLLPTGWHHTFVNSWCENRLGDPSVAMYSGSYDRGKFPPFLKATDCPVAHPI